MISPSKDNLAAASSPKADDIDIPWANWVIRELQRRRIRRPKGEQVDKHDSVVSPTWGEADAAANRGVISCPFCRAGVQHDEQTEAVAGGPAPDEVVAMA